MGSTGPTVEERVRVSRRAVQIAAEELGVELTQDANGVQRAANGLEALSLKMAGLSNSAIARQLGITPHAVDVMIDNLLTETARCADPTKMRALENERLDRLQMSAWPQALNGDPEAVRTVQWVMTRRAKMNGLDAPTRLALSADVRIQLGEALAELQRVMMVDREPDELLIEG